MQTRRPRNAHREKKTSPPPPPPRQDHCSRCRSKDCRNAVRTRALTYESFGSRSPGQIDNRTHSHHTFIRERAHRDSEKYSLCVVDQRDNIIIYLFFFIYNFFFFFYMVLL